MKLFISAILLLCSFSLLAQTGAPSASSAYQSGLHYTEITPAFATDNKEQVVVYEFFGYMCPHCANFQPYMDSWNDKKPDNVTLVRVPVVFNPGWDVYAKAFYTAEAMGILEQSHQAMFDALHKQRKRMNSLEEVAAWYADELGVDKDEFLSTAKSFMIDSKMRQSNNMMRKMDIRSTPTLVVNGKYKLNGKAVGGASGLVDLASYLSSVEVKELNLNQQTNVLEVK
jgi:thiol:disulfide interchange protein DsbA